MQFLPFASEAQEALPIQAMPRQRGSVKLSQTDAAMLGGNFRGVFQEKLAASEEAPPRAGNHFAPVNINPLDPSELNGDFLAAFNEKLAAAGLKPLAVKAEDGPPAGFRNTNPSSGRIFEQEDVEELRESLRKRGIAEENLQTLDGLLQAGNVPGMGGIAMALLGNRRNSAALSEEESLEFGSALRKMGFMQEEVGELETMLAGGMNLAAMQAIGSRLSSLDKDSNIELSLAEVKALGRGLDLSPGTLDKTLALFGNAQKRELNPAGVAALLSNGNAELAEKQKNLAALASELQSAMEEVLQSKQARKAQEAQVDMRGSRQSERSETRMLDDLTARANGLGPEALAQRIREARENHDSSGEGMRQREDPSERELPEDKPLRRAATVFDPQNSQTRPEGSAGLAEDSSVQAAFARVNPEGIFTSVQNTPNAKTETSFLSRPMNEEIFAQVRDGALRELTDGSKQITLRLDPVELGQVSVVLTVKQGEVKALFRTESAEVTAALSDQMSQLKASLEEQGLKVTQLEVQTQLREDPGLQNWSGSDQHNKEQAMREQSRQLRLARAQQEVGNGLARDMQNTGRREEISQTGLHLIA